MLSGQLSQQIAALKEKTRVIEVITVENHEYFKCQREDDPSYGGREPQHRGRNR